MSEGPKHCPLLPCVWSSFFSTRRPEGFFLFFGALWVEGFRGFSGFLGFRALGVEGLGLGVFGV